MQNLKNLVGGAWIDSIEKIEVRNPYSKQLVGTVPRLSVGEVKRAIDALYEYEPKLSAWERAEILSKAAQEVKARKQELKECISSESGMSVKDSDKEVDRSFGLLTFCAEEAKRINGEQIPSDTDSAKRDRVILAMRFPVGVVSAIVPFNRPLNQVVVKVGPALAAGNRVIVKPTERTPMAGIKLCEILLHCGLPPQMLSVVTGKSSEIGNELATNPKIDMLTFTGGTATGRHLSNIAGVKKLTLELGGNDPLIVLEDANLDLAVSLATAGSFGNAGQACRGIKRILVVDKVADQFVEKFVEATKKLKCGNPFDPTTDIGTMISEEAAIEVEKVVEEALRDGAKLLCGHTRKEAEYPPTVLDHVSPTSKIVVEETFGPTAPVIRVKDVEEAVRISNSTIYGLQSGVVTNNLQHIKYVIKHLKVGAVNINEGPQFDMPNIPFGGVKQSGLGREGVKYSIQEMTYVKTIVM